MRTAIRDHQGQCREFLRSRPLLNHPRAEKAPDEFDQIPYSTEQGILKCYQGILLLDQGISFKQQGKMPPRSSDAPIGADRRLRSFPRSARQLKPLNGLRYLLHPAYGREVM